MSFPSFEVNCATVGHVGILDADGGRGVGGNETNNPEDDGEDEGSDGQQEVACQPHHGGVHAVAGLVHLLLLLLLLLSRLDSDYIHPLIETKINCVGSLEHLVGGMQNHLKEGDCHREQHPDVNHLDVRGDW